MKLVAVALALAVLTLPSALAGVDVEASVVRVVVEDARESCEPALPTGACILSANTTGEPGDWSVDARQSIRFAGVATNGSRVPVARNVLAPLLPSEDVFVNVEGTRVAFPVLAWVDPLQDEVPDEVPRNLAYAYYDEEALHTVFFGPNPFDPLAPPETHDVPWRWHEDVSYDSVGSFATLGEGDTEFWVETGVRYPCLYADAIACEVLPLEESSEAAPDLVPGALVGVNVYAAGATTNASSWERVSEARAAGSAASRSIMGVEAPVPLQRHGAEERAALARDDHAGNASGLASSSAPSPDSSQVVVHETSPVPRAPPRSALPLAAAGALGGCVAVAFLVLYRRLTREDVHAQDTRKRLLDVVRARPGIRLTDAAHELGVYRAAVTYHARVLTRHQSLIVRAGRGETRLYAPGAMGALARSNLESMAESARLHPVASAILRAASAVDGAPRAGVLASAPGPRRTAQWHVARLLAWGLLSEERRPEGIVLRAQSFEAMRESSASEESPA